MTTQPQTLDGLLALCANATPGPWCYEAVGEKGDGANIIGVAFAPGDEACNSQLKGRLEEWDDDGNVIDYYRDSEVAVCEHRNQNANSNAAYIAALSPEVVAALCRAVQAGDAMLQNRGDHPDVVNYRDARAALDAAMRGKP